MSSNATPPEPSREPAAPARRPEPRYPSMPPRYPWVAATLLGVFVSALVFSAIFAATLYWQQTRQPEPAAAEAKPVPEPPACVAKALVRAAASQAAPALAEQTSSGADDREVFRRTQGQLLTTRDVLSLAVRNEEIGKLTMVRDKVDPTAWLAENLEVRYPAGTEIIEIRLSGDDPAEVVRLLDAVVEAFVNEAKIAQRSNRQSRLQVLNRVYAEKEQELKLKRRELEQVAAKLGAGDGLAPDVRRQMALEELADLRREHLRLSIEARRKKGQLEGRKDALVNVDQLEIPNAEVDAFAQADPIAQELLFQLNQQLTRSREEMEAVAIRQVSTRYVEQMEQDLQSIQQKIEQRRSELREAIRRQREGAIRAQIKDLQNELDLLAELQQQLAADVEKQRKQVEKIGASSGDLEQAQREIRQLQQVLDNIAAERERVKLQEEAPSRVSVVQQAQLVHSGQSGP